MWCFNIVSWSVWAIGRSMSLSKPIFPKWPPREGTKSRGSRSQSQCSIGQWTGMHQMLGVIRETEPLVDPGSRPGVSCLWHVPLPTSPRSGPLQGLRLEWGMRYWDHRTGFVTEPHWELHCKFWRLAGGCRDPVMPYFSNCKSVSYQINSYNFTETTYHNRLSAEADMKI